MTIWTRALMRMALAALTLSLAGCSLFGSDDDDPPPAAPPPAAIAPGVSSPAAATVIAGQAAVFTVVGTGSGPLSYQWQRNGAFAMSARTPAPQRRRGQWRQGDESEDASVTTLMTAQAPGQRLQ